MFRHALIVSWVALALPTTVVPPGSAEAGHSAGAQSVVEVAAVPGAEAATGAVQGGEIASSTLVLPGTPTRVEPLATPSAAPPPASAGTVAVNSTRARLPQTASSTPPALAMAVATLCAGAGLLLWRDPRF